MSTTGTQSAPLQVLAMSQNAPSANAGMRSSSVVAVSGRSGTVGSLSDTTAAPTRYSVIRRNQSCKDPLGVHISDNVPNPIPRTTDTVLDAVGVLVVLVRTQMNGWREMEGEGGGGQDRSMGWG